MERVTIQEASRRLHLSTSIIRQCIQDGELTAYRNPEGRGWVVEMPAEGWVSSGVAQEMERTFIPWWWANAERTGSVHYVEALFASSFEEMVPQFLCGMESDNIWSAVRLSPEILCPDCVNIAGERGIDIKV
jgi:excisionase family DNA binding protein